MNAHVTHAVKLNNLLSGTAPLTVRGSSDRVITGLSCDSRQVRPGSIFFALPGVKADGFTFIEQALAHGAVAVVSERMPASCPADICFIQVTNVRLFMAKMAADFYGQPTHGVPVIGVTGTNGKTTVTYLLEAVLKAAGFQPAVFGTVEYRFKDVRLTSSHTTPESLDLMRMMAEFRQQGADALILEVSSHALEQHRVDGIHFDLGVFTNLTPEHLDYHETLEKYFSSKRRFFSELLTAGKAVINRDDPFGQRLLQEHPDWLSFGLSSHADIFPQQVDVGRDGISGIFSAGPKGLEIKSGMIGDFNVSNLLAAIAAAQQLGIDHNSIVQGVAQASQVPGRLEKVANDHGILALVDFAHTGDALEQVLKTLTKLEHKRLVTVVGCGGDRDPSKRPVMARVAVEYSNLAVFTSDNPRTEDPLAILDQIRTGALAAGGRELSSVQATQSDKGFIVIPDRRSAIEFACSLMDTGDLLLVAGKGHENYQILGTEKIHFDDREELDRILNHRADNVETGSDGHV